MRLMISMVVVALAGALALGGCSSGDCQTACQKLASCGIDAGTLPCDPACNNNNFEDHSCAGCINGNTCDSIRKGCPSSCPKVHF
jgi:hypothetical protein